ncbi:tyrosine-type recombinase/integrase [Novosphingobium percolationis]|uniref:tyrosine-type recombinase/integrase n=1 Tax=Novosphingobium percolationis TaxID=2871811 RepID=UPI001CD51C61|nr:site-specific integrase [Novosphingobium percolationis]
MSVYKRGNTFYYDFQFRGVRYHGPTGCTSKRKALEVERRAREDAALPSRQRPSITLDEACGLYQDKVEALPSWPTARYMLAALIKGLGGARTLSDVTQLDLQRYYAKRGKGRSPGTINREVDVARAVWAHAEATRFDFGEKPNWRALKAKDPAKPERELSVDEEQRLFSHLREDVRDAVDFLLKSGWRRNEVLNLRWQDCDLCERTAITRIKGGDVIRRPLTNALVEIIRRQPKVGLEVFTYICQKSSKTRRKGTRYALTPTSLRKPFANALIQAEISQLRIHDLRHTRATRIVRSTGSLPAAKAALGHKTIATTQRYAHVLDEDTRRALDASESHNIPTRNSSSAG